MIRALVKLAVPDAGTRALTRAGGPGAVLATGKARHGRGQGARGGRRGR